MPFIRTGRVSKLKAQDCTPRKPFDIPYFAHQELDPEYFTNGSGMSIQDPPADLLAKHGQANNDWDDEEDEDEDFDLDENESDDVSPPKVAANKKKRSHSSATPKQDAFKKQKITGGRPAAAKKVTANFDSDDEIIFHMKNAKFLEKDIAQRLKDEGRTSYNPKTIGTRWARLKQAKQAQQDELLDADLTDWHEGDDDVLYAGLRKAEGYIKEKIKEIESKRWRIVADYLKNVKPVTNFSQNACRDRYEALQAGTAKLTPESDPNPSPAVLARIEARREREQRIIRDLAAAKKDDVTEANIQANGWTSKQKDEYS